MSQVLQRRLLPLALAILASVTAVSCTVGPDYQRPDLRLPTTFKSATTQDAATPQLTPDWWKLFSDPQLNSLMESALDANPTLQAAMARVAQARAAARIAGSQFYPVIGANPGVTRTRAAAGSRGTSSGAAPPAVNQFSVPFDLSYEVDIWGRVRRSYESARAQAVATAADLQVILLTLEADVAQNYFALRLLDIQDDLLAGTVESYRKQVELTHKQVEAKIASPIIEAQAQTLLHSTMAQRIDNRRQRADVEHALAILLGRAPSELSIPKRNLDIMPPSVPAGLPAELLRTRPDVAEAEQNLIAANAQIGVATALFYPQISLTGAAGFESADLAHTLDWQQRFWSIGASAAAPIFQGGRLTANLEQAKARYDELLATYRSRVLSAIGDVEDSLTDLHMRYDQAQSQEAAVKAAQEYLRLSLLQYDRGLISYLQVTDAERTLLSNQLTAAQIRNQQLISSVLLIKALGGGWQMPQPATKPATQPARR